MIIKKLLIPADILCFAPLLILSDVRASAAVAGIPPASPAAILAKLRPSISLFLLCLVFVIPSAMRADIMVSIIAIMEIVKAGMISFAEKIKDDGSMRWGCRLANFVSRVCRSRAIICFDDK